MTGLACVTGFAGVSWRAAVTTTAGTGWTRMTAAIAWLTRVTRSTRLAATLLRPVASADGKSTRTWTA